MARGGRMTQLTIEDYLKTARYEGPVEGRDVDRLSGQTRRIYELMCDGQWRTLEQIEEETGDPQASISAQLRHLRKHRFGGHQIDKRRVVYGNNLSSDALWEYKLTKREVS
jgi:hypothetical protein